MFVIIVGGGKVGSYLIKEFLEKEYEVHVVENNKKNCRSLKKKYGVKVFCGDGTQEQLLDQAGINEADVVLAVTGDDQDNLVICQMSERKFNVPRTFTRVNTPGNEKLFDWLGVNVAVSSSSILTALVEREVTIQDLSVILNKDHDKIELLRITVDESCKFIDKKLRNIDFPLESVLVTILRGDESIVPRGDSIIKENDLVIALTKREYKEELISLFSGG
ncbi:MAG: TrkA family potassium uptake protein [Halanaerobiales bacterium]|nr:TrkA family potassium uptake protein [Halanaerobiales bacterium]